ncbi:hypothetical protein BB558_001927 [Smittium angustum]|uniref:Origin recognition complex subunit 2 n=1 Tax=Smittium angustum TaxID=133377 RepID=A0A2U1JAG1_SMIAN|nr:hypothetical protein BB558_001927 [Smittium angustum]
MAETPNQYKKTYGGRSRIDMGLMVGTASENSMKQGDRRTNESDFDILNESRMYQSVLQKNRKATSSKQVNYKSEQSFSPMPHPIPQTKQMKNNVLKSDLLENPHPTNKFVEDNDSIHIKNQVDEISEIARRISISNQSTKDKSVNSETKSTDLQDKPKRDRKPGVKNKTSKSLGTKKENGKSGSIRIDSEEEFTDDPEKEDLDGAESFFETFKGIKKAATSNNTLALLAKMEVGISEEQGGTKSQTFEIGHASELSRNIYFYKLQYKQWYFELQNGFSLLFYGFGSKRELLFDFCYSILSDPHNPLIVVNGYYPNLNFKSVLENVVLNVLRIPKQQAKTLNLENSVRIIKEYFCNHRTPIQTITFLVHSIDGIGLRKENIQHALSSLSSIEKVYLVASMDHINAPLLWDSSKLSSGGFNFIWHDVTTFNDYIEETRFENYQILHPQHISMSLGGSFDLSAISSAGVLGNTSKTNLVGIQHVMASLTSNAKNIFLVLARFQLKSMESESSKKSKSNSRLQKKGTGSTTTQLDPSLGMEYFQLYNSCREAFLVSNEITFRSLLTEFKDHNIIVFMNESDGSQILYIPIGIEELKTLLNTLQ